QRASESQTLLAHCFDFTKVTERPRLRQIEKTGWRIIPVNFLLSDNASRKINRAAQTQLARRTRTDVAISIGHFKWFGYPLTVAFDALLNNANTVERFNKLASTAIHDRYF